MTFYQELQLNQAGSKDLLKKSETAKEKIYHLFVYMAKVAVTMAFCFLFVTIFSILLGNENSIVGVVVLLCLMVFRNADLGIHTGQSTILLALFFAVMTVCPHLANQLSPVPGMLLNIAALAVLILFGCHNPFMFNQSTLVLGYLLLYGYDVTGKSYEMRLVGMAAGAVLTCLVFYRNHRNRVYKRKIQDVLQEFALSSSRTKWQLCQILCVPAVLCIAELFKMPRAMWAGIAAMSAILPFMEDMQYRVKKRIVGNIAGVLCFTALYFLLPSSIYAYIGILGGIGVGFSAKYGWQAVFNTFGALAIAAESYGLKGSQSQGDSECIWCCVCSGILCYVLLGYVKKTDVSKKSNRLLRKHVVLVWYAKGLRKKWINVFEIRNEIEMLFISKFLFSFQIILIKWYSKSKQTLEKIVIVLPKKEK